MNTYNEFYLHIEKRIEEVNDHIHFAQINNNQDMMDELSDKKEKMIEEAFKEFNVPHSLQEDFKDDLFSDEEFDYLMLKAS